MSNKASDVRGGYMALDMNDLKQRANDLIDQASDVTEDLGSKAKPYVDRAAEAAKPVVEKARPHVDKAKEAVGELADRAKPHVDQAKVTAAGLADKAKPSAERARDWAVSMLDKAFDFLEEQTGTDLDGDGVVGAAVREALEISVEEGAPVEPAEMEALPSMSEDENADEPDIEIPDPSSIDEHVPAQMEVEVIGEELEDEQES